MEAPQKLSKFREGLSNEENLVLEYQLRVLNYLKPYLLNQFRLEEELGHFVKMKEGENPTFGYDVAVNDVLLKVLKEYNFQGELYSEESGLTKFGEQNEMIVTDPICNSSFFRRGFRNVASGVTFFRDENFIAGALTDFGSYTICLANNERVLRLMPLDDNSLLVKKALASRQNDLEKAFIVLMLYSKTHRLMTLEKSDILRQLPLLVEVLGDQPNWARLTQGYVDAFLNPFRGG